MATLKADWHQLGPMPIDPALEEKLSRVKYDNNYAESDESVWIERGRKYAASFAASEDEFFSQLDKQVESL